MSVCQKETFISVFKNWAPDNQRKWLQALPTRVSNVKIQIQLLLLLSPWKSELGSRGILIKLSHTPILPACCSPIWYRFQKRKVVQTIKWSRAWSPVLSSDRKPGLLTFVNPCRPRAVSCSLNWLNSNLKGFSPLLEQRKSREAVQPNPFNLSCTNLSKVTAI